MHRKGFPESYDVRKLVAFMADVKAGPERGARPGLLASVVRHRAGRVSGGGSSGHRDRRRIERAAGRRRAAGRAARIFVSDYFDFSIYIDAAEEDIEAWYVARFHALRETVFRDPRSYFHRYASLSEEEADATAHEIWRTINGVNLRENIGPTRDRARLVFEKGPSHAVTRIGSGTSETSLLECSALAQPGRSVGSLRPLRFEPGLPAGLRFGRLLALEIGRERQRRNGVTGTVLIDRDERQVGPARSCGGRRSASLFGEHVHFHFQRGLPERGGDARLQDDQVADLDRVQELQSIDGRRHQQAARVPVTRDGPGDVDQVHDRAAQDEAQRIGVVGQDHLHHFGEGLGGRGRERHGHGRIEAIED